MYQDKCNLTWHKYSDHLRETMQGMLISDSFTDVTLVSDDKQSIKAHRNILSACSPVFENILLMEIQNHHPVIYLRGIQFSEIESILQFIYLGEAKFLEHRVNEFLSVAKNLEIKEFSNETASDSDVSNSNNTSENVDYNVSETINVECDVADTVKKHNSTIEEQDDKMTSLKNLLAHKVDNIEFNVTDKNEKDNCAIEQEQEGTDDGSKLFNQYTHGGVIFKCNQCTYQAKKHSDLKYHIQIQHEGTPLYLCDHHDCDYQATNKKLLKEHIQTIHEGFKYKCNDCVYQTDHCTDLRNHVQAVHEGIRYPCDQCPYQAGFLKVLKRHIKTRHTGKPKLRKYKSKGYKHENM